MFVKNVHLLILQNEEHFAFHGYVEELIEEATPAILKVESQFAAYKLLLPNERDALDQVQKSSYTKLLDDADAARDKPLMGFFKVVKGQLHHFNQAVSDAAYRVDIINDSFSGIVRLPYEKETVAVVKWLDKQKASMTDIITLGHPDWLVEVEAKNNGFVDLKKSRFAEKDEQTGLQMKLVRADVDDAYKAIIDRINAYITIDGDAQFATFVTKLNNRIDSFHLTLAQRQGRSKKAAEAAAATK